MEPSCNDCFQFNVTHKFKNSLIRHCNVQKDFKNLVAISGGSNSMAMLHLLWQCLNGNKSQKKMFFKIHILYIDEAQAVFNATKEEAESRRNFIIDHCQTYGFSYSIVGIE